MEEFFQAGAKLTGIPRNGGRRKSGLMLVLCAASAICLTSVAGTVYVDNGLESYTGHDGSSWQLAYKTIQEGVNAAADGDTVLVAPGTYGDDQGKVAATTGYHACRVYIDKPITLKSSGGRDVTHLVGNYVEGASTSADAVGGVVIAKAAAAGTVVLGFTIRRCGTSKLGNGSNSNGGRRDGDGGDAVGGGLRDRRLLFLQSRPQVRERGAHDHHALPRDGGSDRGRLLQPRVVRGGPQRRADA